MKLKRLTGIMLALAMVVTMAPVTNAAKKPKLNSSKVSVNVGSTKKITIKNVKKVKSLKWSVKSKKIATVKKNGSLGAKVTGKKVGNTYVYAKFKVGSKKYSLKTKVVVKVKEETGTTPVPTINTTQPTVAPATGTPAPATPTVSPSETPTLSPTEEPTVAPTIKPMDDKSTSTYDPAPGFVTNENEVDASYEESTATVITCNGSNDIVATGANQGAVAIITGDTSSITIADTTGGTYILKGDAGVGQVLIGSKAATELHIVMDNFSVKYDTQYAFYCSEASSLKVTLVGNNTLGDNDCAPAAAEPKKGEATFLVKKDIPTIINSASTTSGKLTVNATRYKAIMVKNTLTIANTTIVVAESTDNAISGTYGLSVSGSDVKIQGNADGLKSGKAGVAVTDSSLGIKVMGDGVQADGIDYSVPTAPVGYPGTVYINANGIIESIGHTDGTEEYAVTGANSIFVYCTSTEETTTHLEIKSAGTAIYSPENVALGSQDDTAWLTIEGDACKAGDSTGEEASNEDGNGVTAGNGIHVGSYVNVKGVNGLEAAYITINAPNLSGTIEATKDYAIHAIKTNPEDTRVPEVLFVAGKFTLKGAALIYSEGYVDFYNGIWTAALTGTNIEDKIYSANEVGKYGGTLIDF